MGRELLAKWLPMADELKQVRTNFNPPIQVILGEAVEVARFLRAHWEPVRDAEGKVLQPGLAQAGPRLPASIGVEILELQEVLQISNAEHLMTVAPNRPDLRARAEFLLGEITAALEWLLDDGMHRDRSRRLASIQALHAARSHSADALAARLADYVALARQESKRLDGLGGFDVGILDEAEQLPRLLRERSSAPTRPEPTQRALDVRNRIATLLIDRISTVRLAARFVFRKHPEIAREAGSTYSRKRRAAARHQVRALGREA